MIEDNLKEQINLYKSLFQGRDDVFAIRWEKGGKSGYFPVSQYDPFFYKMHKINGGNNQQVSNKNYIPYSTEQIRKHLQGDQLIGIYPLLKDNTSWFIVADFDDENWIVECQKFIKYCTTLNIPAYLERSRSGNGGHIWIFFDQPYLASKSRKLFIKLLENAGVFSIFDKGSSFDRLFPSQDKLAGKGFGNLIALPLYKPTWEQGNSCFIDVETLYPYNNQWEFIKNIHKITNKDLDNLYYQFVKEPVYTSTQIVNNTGTSTKLTILLNNRVQINRSMLPLQLITFLKEELNFINTEYLVKMKMNKNTWNVERYYKFIEETDYEILIPRGFIGKLLRYCIENKIEYEFKDDRKKGTIVPFSCDIQLREYQIPVIEITKKKDIGVIVAPPGTGKTVIALKIITDKQQSSLIIVHRKQLADQWSERVQTFLGIPKNEIGKIGQGKSKIGNKITIAMIQSLSKELEKPDNKLSESFGTIIIDECHHIPAETYRDVIGKLNTYYLYGLTATPFRKYNNGKLIFIHLGEIIAELKSQEIATNNYSKIIVRNTELDVPYHSKTDRFETLSNVLIHDSARNRLIINDIIIELNKGKKLVILTERREHIETLNQFLKQQYDTITLSGDDSESSRKSKWGLLKNGNYQILITTGQYFGEGSDLHSAECLFLVYPFSFEGKLIQYIGRVQRSEISPTIYDYRDYKIDYLNKLFLKRNTYYRKLQKQATLFDELPDEPLDIKQKFVFEKQVYMSLDQVEFRYGTFAINYFIDGINKAIEFEIENDDILPEFEILKPYFSKILKLKKIKIYLYAEFVNEIIVAQIAKSIDLQRFNREIIESVKFTLISKTFFGKIPKLRILNNILDINQLQDDANSKLFNTGEEFLDTILKNKNFKHSINIRYLANKHASNILKLRFVISPFSFVFLVTGEKQFHLILETLDTEEATYIWHVEKNKTILMKKLEDINIHLNVIRNEGRQAFLESQPQNFTRILHDYTDERKGFITWKNLLEEIII